MKKFYIEPEMAVKVFEAEGIVTASETLYGEKKDDISDAKYSKVTATIKSGESVLEFSN